MFTIWGTMPRTTQIGNDVRKVCVMRIAVPGIANQHQPKLVHCVACVVRLIFVSSTGPDMVYMID